ncbi:MAG: tetratricopeptide repeat protein [Chloroflexi bacterium]|nr:tetratricopeptide repeat protein [Chloroflexota bacterium]
MNKKIISKPKKEQSAGISADIRVGKDVSGNVVVGDNNVVSNTIIQSAPAPETHPALGSIPPFYADTYVHRGKIEDEVRAALRKGGASAIVGLHAPGGTGKTELAARIAQEVKDGKSDFENVLWVDVNEKSSQEVLDEALRKCGLQLQPSAGEADKKAELHYFLSKRKLLIIFDDVRANASPGLKELLPPAPCAALITSRIQQMAGIKQEFALDHMQPEQARELFVNSLGEDVVKAEEEMVYKLAERCKHNPLALEIASRRIRQAVGSSANPIAKYFYKVEKRFEALKMDGDERWNLTAVFDTSYNDLNETEQGYFRALAVFAPTGFSPNAAARVWNVDEEQAGDILSRFQNLSLVMRVKGDIERFRLHDLLDEYAAPKLNGAGEQEKTESALAEWLINLFEEHDTVDVSNAPEVGLEFANLAKTAEWAIAHRKGGLLALLATKPRNWLYNYFRELNEWLNWLQSSLKLGINDEDKEGKQLKANVLQAIGDVQQFRDERDAALESYNEALKLFKAVGAKLGEANVRKAIGDVQQFRKENDAALESYNEALKLFKAVGAKLGEANVLAALCRLSLSSGNLETAEKQLDSVIAMRRQIGDIYSEGADYGNFAIALLNLGNKAKAKGYALKARDAFEKIGEPTVLKQIDGLIAACDE